MLNAFSQILWSLVVKEKQEEVERAEQAAAQAPEQVRKAWATPTGSACLAQSLAGVVHVECGSDSGPEADLEGLHLGQVA